MRCEVCGVPISDDAKRCDRCASKRASSPPAIPLTHQASTTLELRDKWAATPGTAGAKVRATFPVGQQAVNVNSSVVLEGKYRLREEVGRGAMGTVFLAEDTSLRREVAVKFLLPELADSTECAVRFRQEAVGMAAIRHHNVAQIYAFGEHGNIPYFVMEYLDGQSVETLIDAHNRRGFFFPLHDAIDILVQSLSGIAAIHNAGAVHRDIKPANIMLTDDPLRAVIMDFGLVRNIRVEEEIRSLAGTPAYIAPELVEGRPGAERSPAVDIYSMGTSMYEIITGSLPFGGETWVEILRKHLTDVPLYPSTRRPGIPDEIDDIIMRAMAKDPKERYATCDEFIEDLLRLESESLPEEEQRNSALPGMRTGPVRRSSKKFGSTPRRGQVTTTPISTRGRLVVVDPDPEFRAFVHDAAKAAVPDCRIQSAADGARALALVDEFKPHAIVLDLSLPEINGLEVVATLRGDKDYADIPIIVVAKTGGQREANILKGLDVVHFLTKPVDATDLATLLRSFLERRLSMPRATPSPYN